MVSPPSEHITGLLIDWRKGNEKALEALIPLVYEELRRCAHRYLRREKPGHLLQTTALVHETYLRLIGQDGLPQWQGRTHFFAVAAHLMRQILVDHARHIHAAKRGAGAYTLSLDQANGFLEQPDVNLLHLDIALDKLTELDARQGRIVELRFFAGLSIEETSEALGISPATVKREWATARAWLHRELEQRVEA